MAQRTYTIRVPSAMALTFERESRLSGLSVPRLAKREVVSRLAADPDAARDIVLPKHGAPGINVAIGLNDAEQLRLTQWMARHAFRDEDDARLLSALLFRDAPTTVSDAPSADADGSRLRAVNRAFGQGDRAEQDQIYLAVRRHLDRVGLDGAPHDGKVLFAEAPTGVGKTRAFVVAAVDRLHGDSHRVGLIACPTIALIRQVSSELAAMKSAGQWTPRWRCLFGVGEFVCVASLRELIDGGHEFSDRIEAWLALGGRADARSDELPCYLAGDLIAFLGESKALDPSCWLSHDDADDDPGMGAYKAQFTHDDDVQLIISTHAMVAREIQARLIKARRHHREEGSTPTRHDVQTAIQAHERAQLEHRQKIKRIKTDLKRSGESAGVDTSDQDVLRTVIGETLTQPEMMLGDVFAQRFAEAPEAPARIPCLDFAIIDEAHLFEANLSMSLSSGVSTWAVLHHARALRAQVSTITQADVRALERSFEGLQSLWDRASSSTDNGSPVSVQDSMHGELRAQLGEFRDALSAILKRKRKKGFSSPDLRILYDAARTLDLVLPKDRAGFQAYMSASPVRHYPQILCGRPSIDVELAFFWRKIAHNAVLVSATLGIIGAVQPYDHYRRLMAVPMGLFCTMPPVTPAWLTRGVTLLTPASGLRPDGSVRFAAPRARTTDEPRHLDQWIEEGCGYVHRAIKAAAGGSLMLCGSYRDLDAFKACLDGHGKVTVFAMRRGHRIDECLPDFYAAALDGKKPLLIGVGAAWTGLDIGGHRVHLFGHQPVAAEDDNILTDLFVPRLPFGLNSTITHLQRKARLGLLPEAYATAFHLKQGMGRLVRRPGLPPNRRIHVMDGRLNDAATLSIVTPVKTLFSIYLQREQL